MKKILIVLGRYLPGYKDGGPIRSIANLVEHLGDEYEFFILTSDRDTGDEVGYPNIKLNEWNSVGKAHVMYVYNGVFTSEAVLKATADVELIYICGCFNQYARLILSLSKKKRITAPIIIAPMGLFSEGAFRIHYCKKKLYISLMKSLGMFRNVVWSVTSEMEREDVKRIISSKASIEIARDLPRKVRELIYSPSGKKEGKLNICFLSRIDSKKNLKYAIQLLKNTKCDLNFDIYGPIQDESYWEECRQELKDADFTWEHKGIVPSEETVSVFAKHDLFLFPTKGENYGHVIVEALSASRPVVISNETPWNDLEEHNAGFSISLEDADEFINVLESYASMGQSEYDVVCQDAYKYACFITNAEKALNQYREMFNKRIDEQ